MSHDIWKSHLKILLKQVSGISESDNKYLQNLHKMKQPLAKIRQDILVKIQNWNPAIDTTKLELVSKVNEMHSKMSDECKTIDDKVTLSYALRKEGRWRPITSSGVRPKKMQHIPRRIVATRMIFLSKIGLK